MTLTSQAARGPCAPAGTGKHEFNMYSVMYCTDLAAPIEPSTSQQAQSQWSVGNLQPPAHWPADPSRCNLYCRIKLIAAMKRLPPCHRTAWQRRATSLIIPEGSCTRSAHSGHASEWRLRKSNSTHSAIVKKGCRKRQLAHTERQVNSAPRGWGPLWRATPTPAAPLCGRKSLISMQLMSQRVHSPCSMLPWLCISHACRQRATRARFAYASRHHAAHAAHAAIMEQDSLPRRLAPLALVPQKV